MKTKIKQQFCDNLLEVFNYIYDFGLNIEKIFNGFEVSVSNKSKIKITKDGVFFNEMDLTEKLIYTVENNELYVENYKEFFKEIRDRIVELYHVGVSYSCLNIKSELELYRRVTANDNELFLTEEVDNNDDARWFFFRNTNNRNTNLFEVVLKESMTNEVDIFRPHFQIDINTTMSKEELEALFKKYFKKDFVKLAINVPEVGVVLFMGDIINIYGMKVFLGFGTNFRKTDQHAAGHVEVI